MSNTHQQLELFFKAYAERFNQALQGGRTDVDETANAFADCFIEASPAGIVCGKNDATFREQIPKGYAFYRSIGMTAMNIISTEITILDDDHSIVKVYWQSKFVQKDQQPGSMEFPVYYFLQSKGTGHKIFSYITGDEQKALRENGLI